MASRLNGNERESRNLVYNSNEKLGIKKYSFIVNNDRCVHLLFAV
jgi:hypothetical protein